MYMLVYTNKAYGRKPFVMQTLTHTHPSAACSTARAGVVAGAPTVVVQIFDEISKLFFIAFVARK